MKILIIDDSTNDATIISLYIKEIEPSAEITQIELGKESIPLIRSNDYDCVFLDYRLPDINGLELLKEIHDVSTGLCPHPMVMLTGMGDESLMVQALEYGVQDYLTKGNITPDTLLLAITKAKHVYAIKKSDNETKDKLSHSQKLEALGKLTGGIAHDFNNILAIISGNCHLLDNPQNKLSEDVTKKIKTIRRAANRGADLVEHLMVFSRHRQLKPKSTCINDVIENMLELLERTIGKTISVTTDLQADLWYAHIDKSQLEHMMINFSANARDAMPEGGDLKISTQNIKINKSRANKLDIKSGDYACMTIQDNGSGISKDIIDKIFDPFFTTKDSGKGTGLGMSIAYGFAKDSGGTIEAISKINQGSKFNIFFPRSSAPEEEQETKKPDVIDHEGHGTILVVEDEEDLNDIALTILEAQGYNVLRAYNADEAMLILLNDAQKIDLLFTDIVMPGDMNGIQLAVKALKLKPTLNILFTTGFIKGSIPDHDLLKQHIVLDKPYNPNNLLATIQKVLT